MANKRLKGITIVIDGNTTKLTDAIENMNKTIYNANSELKDLNKALKLDPKNTELLSQKQEVLKNNIAASKDKLEQLKTAQKQMGDYNHLTEEQKESYRALSVEIAKSENAIKSMNKELKETNSIDLSKVKDALKKVGDIAAEVIKKVAAVVAAVGSAIAGVVAAGVKSYAEYEQQVGGIKAIFAGNQELINKVLNTGSKAWKDLTLSQTDYFKTFTSTYPLIKNSIDDENKAIDTTNRMIQLESDLANTFGYDISTASNAINWALKGSFNYIDNLNLGIKGTKEGFLEAAKSCGYVVKSVDELTSDEILNVLEQYADKYGVLGRTSDEAAKTVQGSLKSMKAAWDNFLNGSGTPDQLAESIVTFINNVSDVILKLAPSILSGLTTLIQKLLPKVGKIIVDMLPQLFKAAQDLISSLLKMIRENVQPLADTVVSLFMNLVDFILENLPMIIETGLQIIAALALGIAEHIDDLIPTVIDTVLKIVDVLLNNIDLIVNAAFKLFIGIVTGIIKSTPKILAELPKLLLKIVNTLLPGVSSLINVGIQFVKGIWQGISNSLSWIKDKLKSWVGNVVNFVKKIFGIHSPSKVMEKQVGENLGLGIAEGIDNTVSDVEKAMRGLTNKVEASVNPTINPTANSNPLIIQIENFNNTRQTDIQALAEELEFYRKNSSLAKGGA